ncbi:MAG: LysE family translocator [Pseudomonas sp.]|jgi:threonine/homoserine/homoserine lactone efflux protein|uniref:LysE family translocator n=1 Tax=unclassified Pseudomonas TaxID=196821 RepID=UPI000C82F667|nr:MULTISPECIES: LysE family translocator [unclassified Pseudomonas]MDP9061571.1 LysE family translocator [Pseudomonadota bacterium]AUO22891.1 lysine transporter LysE [Pseudomonas sp. NC02]MDE1911126.1 LysE family translocator [Pseudomonas sp.]MDE2033176.1 LysE family translocator [Pseudomonas sp.]MDE2192915.1 LysE family translocator [Pseudomonas sp.]
MFELAPILTYVAVVIGLFLIPGPAVLLVITRTLQGGRKVGIATGLGVASGDLIHTLCAALGLSAILMTSAVAFNVVKIVGACYLIYLGIRAFMAKPGATTRKDLPTVTSTQAYFQAVGAEVLNPKTAIFFLAFLPQFIHPESGSSLAQFAVLGLIFSGLSAVYTTLISLAIRPLSQWMVGLSRLRRWEGKIIGTLFMGLGLKIAFQQR